MEEKNEMIFVENGKSKKRILITLGVILLLVVGIFVYIKLYYSASSFLTKTAKTLSRARKHLYEDVELISFSGKKCRTDICEQVEKF